jgi:hypothetical protein
MNVKRLEEVVLASFHEANEKQYKIWEEKGILLLAVETQPNQCIRDKKDCAVAKQCNEERFKLVIEEITQKMNQLHIEGKI